MFRYVYSLNLLLFLSEGFLCTSDCIGYLHFCFSYTIKEPEDGVFGTIDKNGTWSGIIAQLINKVSISTLLFCFSHMFRSKISLVVPTPSVSINTSIAACIGIHCDAWEWRVIDSQASQCMPIQAATLALTLTLGVGKPLDVYPMHFCFVIQGTIIYFSG